MVLTPLHDPLRLAEDAAVVDQLSGGRLILGLGHGWREEEFRMFGVATAERAKRTEETIEVLRRAWTGRRFSFEGDLLHYDSVRVTPAPARAGGPPVFLGGYDRRAVRRAGRLADGYITDETGPDELAENLGVLDDGARGVGRDPSGSASSCCRTRSPGATTIRGRRSETGSCISWGRTRPGEPARTRRTSTVSSPSRAPTTSSGSRRPPARPRRSRARSAGSSSDLGGRDVHLVVRLHYPGMGIETAARAIELFAAEVLPALRHAG